MRIASLDTLRHRAHPNLLLVQVRAEDGTVGLGETFFDPDAVEAQLHTVLAPALLGADVEDDVGFAAPSSGMRSPGWSARSALDLALHDLRARLRAVPLYDLIGGRVRESVPVYVTCIDPDHPGASWGLGVPGGSDHEDWTASFERPAELARELQDHGFGMAKLFPFEGMGGRSDESSLEPAELERRLEPLREMREAAGSEFGLACDLTGAWELEPAIRIARALEETGLSWLEDPLAPEDLGGLRRLSESTDIPLAGHEARAGEGAFRELLAADAISLVHMDVQWCGGLTEATRIAGLAATRSLPVAFHDCAGPVAWACSLHAALAIPNAAWLECTRPYLFDAYPAMVDGLPPVQAGSGSDRTAPGHGLSLTEGFLEGVRTRSSPHRRQAPPR